MFGEWRYRSPVSKDNVVVKKRERNGEKKIQFYCLPIDSIMCTHNRGHDREPKERPRRSTEFALIAGHHLIEKGDFLGSKIRNCRVLVCAVVVGITISRLQQLLKICKPPVHEEPRLLHTIKDFGAIGWTANVPIKRQGVINSDAPFREKGVDNSLHFFGVSRAAGGHVLCEFGAIEWYSGCIAAAICCIIIIIIIAVGCCGRHVGFQAEARRILRRQAQAIEAGEFQDDFGHGAVICLFFVWALQHGHKVAAQKGQRNQHEQRRHDEDHQVIGAGKVMLPARNPVCW